MRETPLSNAAFVGGPASNDPSKPGQKTSETAILTHETDLSGVKTAPKPPRNDRLVVRCTPAYHAWAASIADVLGVDLSELIELGLRRAADHAAGFAEVHEPPPRWRPKPKSRRRPRY